MLPPPRKYRQGFTLAELLIALAILGVIATFTIPKVLTAQQNGAWNSAAKEAAGTISAAYQKHQLAGLLSTSTQSSDLTPYMNYVSVDTSSTIDQRTGLTSISCASTAPCLRLHNGGVLWASDHHFGGTGTTNFIFFNFDPDGNYSGNTTGPGKSVCFDLHYAGQLTESSNRGATDTTYDSGNNPQTWGADPASDWFHWN